MSYTERRKPLSSCRENSCTSTLMNLHNRQKHRSRLRVFKCIKALNYLTEICFKLLILRGMKVCFVCIITGVTYNQTFSFPWKNVVKWALRHGRDCRGLKLHNRREEETLA
jgi:hypothetical protein